MVKILWRNINAIVPVYKWLVLLRNEKALSIPKQTVFGYIDRMALYLKLKECIEREELFLNKELSLSFLSKKLHTNSNYLSKAVNTIGNKSFIDFINYYRIEYSKTMLSDDHYSKYTIQTISEKSGFHSTSAFYNAFRKHTTVSPGVYAKMHKNS